jgi:hypothetical protein
VYQDGTFLDNTVVSVALGDVQTSLKANVTDLQWVVGAYALTFASLMLACGMIGDELGRKKVMLAGVGVFCAGSVLCATAPNVQVLIAGRAVMGLGAAASEPGTLSMLRHMYPDARALYLVEVVGAGVCASVPVRCRRRAGAMSRPAAARRAGTRAQLLVAAHGGGRTCYPQPRKTGGARNDQLAGEGNDQNS